jgi:hypothetical protein
MERLSSRLSWHLGALLRRHWHTMDLPFALAEDPAVSNQNILGTVPSCVDCLCCGTFHRLGHAQKFSDLARGASLKEGTRNSSTPRHPYSRDDRKGWKILEQKRTASSDAILIHAMGGLTAKS